MPDSLAYQLFYGATRAIHETPMANVTTQAPTTTGCACCTRSWLDTEDSTVPGSSGVVLMNADGEPELNLGLPDGFISKFKDGHYAKAGQIHPIANGIALLAYLFEAGILNQARLEKGIVFIESWGRKADVLMRSLRSTRSLSEVWCCSDAGASMLDLANIIKTGKWLNEAGVLDKTAKTSFWSPLKAATEGKARSGAIEKWAVSVQKMGLEPQALVNQLPVDPHSRMRVGPVLQLIAPALKEGVF